VIRTSLLSKWSGHETLKIISDFGGMHIES